MEIKTIFGVTIGRIQEVIDLFMEDRYDIKDDKQFEDMKRHYFNKVKE